MKNILKKTLLTSTFALASIAFANEIRVPQVSATYSTAEHSCDRDLLVHFYNETAASAESPLARALVRVRLGLIENNTGEDVAFSITPNNVIQSASEGVRGQYVSSHHVYVMANGSRWDRAHSYFEATLVEDTYLGECKVKVVAVPKLFAE